MIALDENKTALPDNETIEVTMFGQFEIRVGGHSINDSINRTNKLWSLLEYLITFKDKEISQQELIDALWPGGESDNPVNALKNLVYRVRTILISYEIPHGKELIVHRRNSYCWNSAFPCRVDTEEFERLCKEAGDTALLKEERLAKYEAAVQLYKGDFLPKSAYDEWVVPLNTHYHALFLRAVGHYIELLEEESRWNEMETACERALIIDQFEEELHEKYLRCLIKTGKPQKALSHYNYVTELFYRKLGVKPGENIRELYKEIVKTEKAMETDLDIIKNDLSESQAAKGAFCCEYAFFKEIYRLEARSAERLGQAVFIGLLTVTTPDNKMPKIELLNNAMDCLLEVIQEDLRKGDVVARFSAAQYVLMLPTLTYENGLMVLNRIIKKFNREHPRLPVVIHTKLQPLDPVDLQRKDPT